MTTRGRHAIERDLFVVCQSAVDPRCTATNVPTTANVVAWTAATIDDAACRPLLVPLLHELIESRRLDLALRCTLVPELYEPHAQLVAKLECMLQRAVELDQ